jgi:hypothetical protein
MILRVLRLRIVIFMCMLLTIGSAGSSNAQDPERIFKQFFEVMKEIQRNKDLRNQNRNEPQQPIATSPAVPYKVEGIELGEHIDLSTDRFHGVHLSPKRHLRGPQVL